MNKSLLKRLSVAAKEFLREYCSDLYNMDGDAECGFADDGKSFYFFCGTEKFVVPLNLPSAYNEYDVAKTLFRTAKDFDIERYVDDAIRKQVENPSCAFAFRSVYLDAAERAAMFVGFGFAMAMLDKNEFGDVEGFGLHNRRDGFDVVLTLPYNLSCRVFVPADGDNVCSALSLGRILVRDKKQYGLLYMLREQNPAAATLSMAQFLVARCFAKAYLWTIFEAIGSKKGLRDDF